MAKKNKPPSKIVTFRVTEEQAQRIAAEAEALGVTKTDLIIERVLGRERDKARVYQECRFHPKAGAVLVNRRWYCKHPGCPEVLS